MIARKTFRLLGTLLLLTTFASVLAQPANDDACNAINLPVDGNFYIFDNVNATTQVGEPAPPAGSIPFGGDCFSQDGWCASDAGDVDNTVWFTFTAPATGSVIVSTCNANTQIDPQLAVYSVGLCSDFTSYTLLGANDDDPSFCSVGSGGEAVVYLNGLTTGNVYYVQLDGFAGDEGIFYLSISQGNQPTNDNICNAAPVTVGSTPFCGSSILATTETGEPAGSDWFEGAQATVWFTFIAPASGRVVVSTNNVSTNFDTQIAVYESSDNTCTFANLTELGSNDDVGGGNFKSELELECLSPGRIYYVQLDGYFGEMGDYCLLIDELSNPNPIILNINAPTQICAGESVQLTSTSAGGNSGFALGSNNTTASIPDNSLVGASSVIGLNGSGNVDANSLIEIKLTVTHTWSSDVDIYLVGPGNCGTLELSTDNGGSLSNAYNNTTFRTDAATIIAAATAPYTGTYRPEGTITTPPNLASGTGGQSYPLPATAVNGCPVDGNWTLRVFDDASGDVGTLQNWSLLISQPGAGYTHIISGPGTINSSLQNEGAVLNAIITDLPVGENTFTTSVTDLDACTITATHVVKVYNAPEVTSVDLVCPDANSSNGSITINADLDNANFSGADIGVVEFSANNGNTWTTNNLFDNLAAGSYRILLRNSASTSCVYGAFFTLPGGASVNFTNTGPVCAGSDITINAAITSSTDIKYSGNNQTAQLIPDQNATGISSVIGLYAPSGNISTANVVEVKLNITHTFTGDLDIYLVGPNGCGTLELSTDNGGSGDNYTNTILRTDALSVITLGSAPFTGTFRPEGTITTAPNLTGAAFGGTYNLPATPIDGCPVSGNWTLRVFDDAAGDVGTLQNWELSIFSPGGTFTHAISGPGNIGTLTTSGADNQNGEVTISGLPFGINQFTYTVTTPQGCENDFLVDVEISSVANISAGNDIDLCSSATVTLTATGGVDYVWSTTETTASIDVTPLVTTTYSVTGTDANNCTGTADVTVTLGVAPTAILTPGATQVCEGTTILFTSNASGGTLSSTPASGSDAPNVLIPDASLTGVSSSVNIVGNGNISSGSEIQITLNINHSFVADLDAYLVGPGNCGTLQLFTDVGGAGDNFTNTVLNTTATNIIGSTGNNLAPFTGTYGPQGTVTTSPVLNSGVGAGSYNLPANALEGCPIDGNWTLRVFDDATGDVGTLLNWTLEISNPNYSHSLSGPGTISQPVFSGNNQETAEFAVSNIPAGSYDFTIFVTDGQGCDDDATVTIKVFPIPVFVSATTVCSRGTDGEISVVATIDNANLTGADLGVIEYSFDGGNTWDTDNIETGLIAGIYQVYLRNSANTSCASGPFAVEVGDAPVIVAANTSPVCVGSDVTISSTVSGGILSSSVSGSAVVNTAIPDNSTTGVSSIISLSGNSGTISPTSEIEVAVNILHTWDSDVRAFLIGPNNCGVMQLFAGVGGSGDNFVNTVLNTSATNIIGTTGNNTPPFTGTYRPQGTITTTPSGAFTTQYSLPATPLDGCPAVGDWTIRVFDGAAGDVGTFQNWSLSIEYDNDYSQTITGPGTLSPITYTGANNSFASLTASDLPVGTSDFTITVEDVTGCSSSETTTAKVFDTPTNVLVSATCAGPLGGSITVTADPIENGNFTGSDIGDWEYSFDGGAAWTLNNTATGLFAGNYDVYVRNTAYIFCQAGPFAVEVYEAPTVSVADTSVCPGTFINLVATSPNQVDFVWSTTETTSSISINAAGDYYVTVTDANNCTAADTATVTANTLLIVDLGDYVICDGDSVVLDAGYPGATYTWSNQETTQTITVFTTDTYSVLVELSGCTGADASQVIVNPVPTRNLTDLTICEGDTALFDAGNAGDDYLWSTTETTQTIEASVAGTYYVTITNAFSCVTIDTAELTVNPLPLAVLQDVTQCDGTTVTLDADNVGSTYFWSTTEATQTIDVTVAGEIIVLITNQFNCSISDTANVFFNALPVADAGAGQTICEGESATLTASGAPDFVWSTTETTASISVSPTATTTYTVTVTDANSCSAAASVTVTVNANPAANISGNLNTCSTVGTTLTASGGVDYLWNTGATTDVITVLPQVDSTFTVVVTDANNCSATASATVIVTTGPTANAGSDVGICEGGVVTLFGAGGITFEWNTGVTTSNLTVAPITTTTYTLTVTDLTGCSASDDVTVFVNPAPVVTLTIPNNQFCNTDAAVTLTATPPFGTLSGAGVTGNSFDPADAGIGGFLLTYSYTDANSCKGEASVTVSVQNCVGIEELIAALEVAKVYPNPFTNGFNISFTSNDYTDISVKMMDVVGKEIFAETVSINKGENHLKFDTDNALAQGLYYVQLEKDGYKVSFKIMRAH